jgi:aspartate ammonia-lyase
MPANVISDSSPPSTPARFPQRRERDFLGEASVPDDAYYGVHTLRALDSYQISGREIGQHDHLVRAYAQVKWACAVANAADGRLDRQVAAAITCACKEIAEGGLRDQFVVDPIQGGAGTSTNMNVNEVIANRTLELLGRPRGDYKTVHPIEHVNLAQSTNDTYPTALRIALAYASDEVLGGLTHLVAAFDERAAALNKVVKIGRTQLQDAVPMTLGQELKALADMLRRDVSRLRTARNALLTVNLGGTAIGTGVLAPEVFRLRALSELRSITALPITAADNLIEATQDAGDFLSFAGVLKRLACGVSKACNDLRLLSSGPQTGFGDITLPARSNGSSIMPGKVNPVIPEVVNQVAFETVGAEATVAAAVSAGQLQLNAFLPVVADTLLTVMPHLTAAFVTLADHCVSGLRANRETLVRRVETSDTFATLISDYVGYEEASRLVKDARKHNDSVIAAAVRAGLLNDDQAAMLLTLSLKVDPRTDATEPALLPLQPSQN